MQPDNHLTINDNGTIELFKGVNSTFPVAPTPTRHIAVTTEVVLTVCYIVGIAGNLAALLIVIRGGRRIHRNARHALMLRCLAANDLVALVGMLVMMEAQLHLPRLITTSRAFCGLRVLWRLFGLGSGSVALVMAVERWLALTRPFLYQKRVTYHVVQRAVFSLWGCVLLLVILPLVGFGLYFHTGPNIPKCARYRQATQPLDVAYAYLYFTFGMLLIICIVACNLAVMRHLWRGPEVPQTSANNGGAGASKLLSSVLRRGAWNAHAHDAGQANAVKPHPVPQPSTAPLGRRISRSSSRMRALRHSESLEAATHEEMAFARLMALLCVLFVLCWLPQMMTIPLTQLKPHWVPGQKFTRIADFSLLVHFMLDPFVYVLQRCTRTAEGFRPLKDLVLALRCCGRRCSNSGMPPLALSHHDHASSHTHSLPSTAAAV